MAWRQFISVIPVVIDFVKELNLPPRATLFATSGIIFGIAYSYKYFKPYFQNDNLQELPNDNLVESLNETSLELQNGLQGNEVEQELQQNQVEDIPVFAPENIIENNNENEPVLLRRNLAEQDENRGINLRTPQYGLQQNVQNADQVFGTINNRGDNQRIEIGCKK